MATETVVPPETKTAKSVYEWMLKLLTESGRDLIEDCSGETTNSTLLAATRAALPIEATCVGTISHGMAACFLRFSFVSVKSPPCLVLRWMSNLHPDLMTLDYFPSEHDVNQLVPTDGWVGGLMCMYGATNEQLAATQTHSRPVLLNVTFEQAALVLQGFLAYHDFVAAKLREMLAGPPPAPSDEAKAPLLPNILGSSNNPSSDRAKRALQGV